MLTKGTAFFCIFTSFNANLPSNNKNYIKEYTSLNHLFQNCTPTTAMNYAAIEETISTEVLSDIAKWIKSVSGL